MSIVEGFNYVDSTKQNKTEEKEMETDIKKEDIVDSASEDDNDSLADSPMDGIERYKIDYNNVIEGVFGKKSTEGADHAEFISKVKAISAEIKVDEVEQIYTHVICNQYAKVKGIKCGNEWEKLDSMWDLYKSGKLPRLKKRLREPKKSNYNFKKSKVIDTDDEDEDTEKGFYVYQTLEKHNLSHLSKLEFILDRKASGSSKSAIKSIKRLGMHVFQDEDLIESFLPDAALEFLKKHKSLTLVTKKSDDFPQEVTSYGEYGQTVAGEEEEVEDRVRWIDDVFEEELEFNIEGHPNSDRILLKLEAQNANRAVKQIAMKCGSLFIQRYKRQPLEKDEEGRNIYKNCHLAAMKDIYNKVKAQYVK